MDVDKSILLQKQIRNNSEDLQGEFLDMKNWEEQMKKADTEIRSAVDNQSLPPVRRKKKASKEISKPQNKENATKTKRIKSSDYSAWEKFDVNKACEEVDRADQSDDQVEEQPSKEELEKRHTEATEHKEQGNNFVKQQQWAKAVSCYSKAIKVFPYDAVFFANRALCHLKMDNLYSAEADCTAAIQLDEFYIKAYHRRATARISLKQYEEAARDLSKILKLEPSNKEAKTMLVRVNKSIDNSKPLIVTTTRDKVEEPEVDKKIGKKLCVGAESNKKMVPEKVKEIPVAKTIEKEENKKAEEPEKQIEIKVIPRLPEWIPEVHEDFEIVNVITKPPHQRSKKPLRTVPIKEIEFGSKIQVAKDPPVEKPEEPIASDEKKKNPSSRLSEAEFAQIDVPEAPRTAVQFLLTWRKNASLEFRHQYFKKIPAERIPILFQDSMESDTFSEILNVLRLEFTKNKEPVLDYLRHLSEVKRFRTLTMFMSKSDKEDVRALLDYSKTVEGQSDDVIKDLHVKYEI